MGPYTDECAGQEMAKERAYYAQSDGRKASNVRATREMTPLERLVNRVEALTNRMGNDMSGVADQLSSHADRVNGPAPEADTGRGHGVSEDFGPGMLGHLFRAVDNLEFQYGAHMERLATAAGRNCTLA
jgi:hypothetical protein